MIRIIDLFLVLSSMFNETIIMIIFMLKWAKIIAIKQL